jgi:uncharacterized protein YaaR (DUF327 family)
MEKIEGADSGAGILGTGLIRPPKPKTEGRPASKGGKGGFRSLLSRAGDERVQDPSFGRETLDSADDGVTPIDELLDDVTELGEDMRRDPTMERIKGYKAAIRRFMARVVKESYIAEEKSGGGTSFKKRKKYTIVRVVDEKLESLAAEILRHQRDQLEILRRMDEIRGLLVDLMR